MTERPILFSGPMVRAILAGTKTQTRRLVTDLRATVRSEVRADLADLLPEYRGTVARPGKAKPATFNPHGAVCVIAEDGRPLGVKPGEFDFVCPYAAGRTYLDGGWRIEVEAGSRLWVRETFSHGPVFNADVDYETRLRFRANEHDSPLPEGQKWQPSIFMRRALSRITLEVTEVRVQRLQDISEEDATGEGVQFDGTWWLGGTHPIKGTLQCWPDARTAFSRLWDSINGKRAPWSSNPWVWAITFKGAA